VPATERAFDEAPPLRLYVDTNVYLAYLVTPHPQHARARALFTHLAQHNRTTLYLSSVIWTELVNAVCHPQTLRILPADTKQQLGLQRWSVFRVQRDYRRHMLAGLAQLLAVFDWAEVPFTREVRIEALAYLDRYYLDSNDAIHLASATTVEVSDFASFDKAFRPVDGLSLWNDRMHARRPPAAPSTD
jgi:predicted nucleic acid-binding protein